MKVDQISIFVENKSGRLGDVTATLADADVNIRALSLADTADFGILRLIVNNTDQAIEVLKKNGFTVSKTNVVAVEVPDRPGGLAGILRIVSQAEINVAYMYAFVERNAENAIIVFRFDELDRAIEALGREGVRILSAEEVYNL